MNINFTRNLLMLFFLCCCISLYAQKERISLNSSETSVVWKVKPATEAGKDIQAIMSPTYNMDSWVDAVVPGTVFGAYVESGLEADPNFGDNVYKVDCKKYDRNFWYRGEFATPEIVDGERLWLNFEGINRKGEVYFNGQYMGLLDGFMHRGFFDITGLLSPEGKNIIAILVYWPQTPVQNHASPTYLSSSGWDWMPYVPGLLSGITDDVFLTKTREVSIIDPWIQTKVPSKNEALLSLQLDLKNHTNRNRQGVLKGIIQPGNIEFEQEVDIDAGKQRTFRFGDRRFREFIIENPKLWWPNGYGEPNLYTCELFYYIDGVISDSHKLTFGIREYDFVFVDSVARLKVNGEDVFVKGANWGMSEWMLRCRGDEYDLKVKLHHDMNFNMIRNWLGSVADEEFYDACDKYGIMVWDDFWLNSHPNRPDDVFAFNFNAVEKIKRLRNHACIAVWCGDNGGYPMEPLNGWLAENIKTFDGGDRHYHANSNSDGLSGSGPWTNEHPIWYFNKNPLGFGKNVKKGHGFRTEIGTAVFTNFESFKKFIPEENWWPRNEMWNKHFFGGSAVNAGSDKYFSTVEKNYGIATGIEDFCRKAQLANIEINKAMFEGWQHNIWKDATGILSWFGQSAYPSLVWQTYDYYYDLNGAYWGVKKACEPVHIQWSYADNSVKVINTTLNELRRLTAVATVYNLDGQEMVQYGRIAPVTVAANTDTRCFNLNFTTDNLAYMKKVVASSTSNDARDPEAITDGSEGSRWASNYTDDEWIYVDLGELSEVTEIILNWERAHAKSYKLQVSDDAVYWKDIYSKNNSKGGVEEIKIKPVKTRYVRMKGLERATEWGYSIYEMEIYGKEKTPSGLSPVHFIKLSLTNDEGAILSENFYWRANRMGDYTALNDLKKAKLEVSSGLVQKGNRKIIRATIKNAGTSVAFAIHVQPYRTTDGERILPIIMNDNYFTLMKGESKELEMEFDAGFLSGGEYELKVMPYNN